MVESGGEGVWVDELDGKEQVDLKLSLREMELWQGFGPGRIPSALPPGRICCLPCCRWITGGGQRKGRMLGERDLSFTQVRSKMALVLKSGNTGRQRQ